MNEHAEPKAARTLPAAEPIRSNDFDRGELLVERCELLVVGHPLMRGVNAKRRRRALGTRVVARELPAIVAAAAVGDDVLRNVLDDEILAADAERRLLVEHEAAGGRRVPPHDEI